MGSRVAFYRTVLRALRDARIPFLIGGGYATARHTHIDRAAKDLDILIKQDDWPASARALRGVGIRACLPYPHWLGKAIGRNGMVDIIFNSGNAVARVDDDWFEHAVEARVLGFSVRLCPPEELLWSKAFVMERERFDGADVLHIILTVGRRLDWHRLCRRFEGHEPVLLAHLNLFGYVYPGQNGVIPPWVVRHLAGAPGPAVPAGARLCRGTVLSRQQYLVDVTRWGFLDGRLPPYGRMTARERAIWTAAIKPAKPAR
jgi:hypothetical protein